MHLHTTWFRPVAVSLLLHAALMALFTLRLSASSPDQRQLQTLTVELSGKAPSIENKSPLQKINPIVTPYKNPLPLMTEQAAVVNATAEQAQPAAMPEQASNNILDTLPALEPSSTSLNIQPLSKLTRPPAFLHRIEPVYPSAEQRAGSQASVLAEVTINAQGNVLEIKIIKSAGNAFDQAVIEALRKSIFVPGYIGKNAVAVRVLVPFRFNLR